MPDDEDDPSEATRNIVRPRNPLHYCERCAGGLTYPDVQKRVRVCRRCREEAEKTGGFPS